MLVVFTCHHSQLIDCSRVTMRCALRPDYTPQDGHGKHTRHNLLGCQIEGWLVEAVGSCGVSTWLGVGGCGLDDAWRGLLTPAVGWTSFQRSEIVPAILRRSLESTSVSISASSLSICFFVRLTRFSSASGIIARAIARASMSRWRSSAFSRAIRAMRDSTARRWHSLAVSCVNAGARLARFDMSGKSPFLGWLSSGDFMIELGSGFV